MFLEDKHVQPLLAYVAKIKYKDLKHLIIFSLKLKILRICKKALINSF